MVQSRLEQNKPDRKRRSGCSGSSEEQFITEHYGGYAAQRDGGCMEYEVAHPRWGIWKAKDPNFEGDTEQFYGKELAAVLSTRPSSAFLAEGSEVTVYGGRRI